ncbi:disulfide bond formation protein B [Paragemmobacter ruber]|uniref:Disulfide bond formation protein B n=1 Tax=Paragemmobacter ruber TaxID=1985673 RepID=A0ABW9YAL1_9RHOB|nr:disulfide bond formation protein B [Rhodobacter ruber]NBE09578.1 disulfide bond formation protein B [Rhodobacter ruber]
MTTDRRTLAVLIAAGGSASVLAAAFAFQYLGGLAPCQLCLWQRWPHAIAVAIGLPALMFARGVLGRLLPLAGALAALASAGIGAFHVGVEQKWWEGLASCTAGSISGISTADLLNPDVDVGAVVRCDEIAWSMFGLSMAGWNVVLSALLALVWITAYRRAS